MIESTPLRSISEVINTMEDARKSGRSSFHAEVSTDLLPAVDDSVLYSPGMQSFVYACKMNGIINDVHCTLDQDAEYLRVTDGQKRVAAAKFFNLPTIPARISVEKADTTSLVSRYVQSDNRKDFVSKSREVAKAIELDGLTNKQLAIRLCMTEASISGYMKIAKLPNEILEEIRTSKEFKFTLNELLKVARTESSEAQKKAFDALKDQKKASRAKQGSTKKGKSEKIRGNSKSTSAGTGSTGSEGNSTTDVQKTSADVAPDLPADIQKNKKP